MVFLRFFVRTIGMCLFRARVEQYVFLCFLSLLGVLVISWVAVERHFDPRTSYEVRQHRQKEVLDILMRDLQERNIQPDSDVQQTQNPTEALQGDSEQLAARDEENEREGLNSRDRNNKVKPEASIDKNINSDEVLGTNNLNGTFKSDSKQSSNVIASPPEGYPQTLNKSMQADKRLTFTRKVKRKLKKNNVPDPLGKLSGGEAKVKIYSTKSEISEEFECIKLNIKPATLVCLHENEDDVHVSQNLRGKGIWEPHLLRLYQNHLFQNPELGVYDIGSHVGQYSLLAAVMGHNVVAVDPFLPNLRRLHKGIKLNKIEDKVIVAQNAVSDERDTFELTIPSDNRGGVRLSEYDADRFCNEPTCPPHTQTIFMDDLLEVTNFKAAIIKIDIEGHEHRAFRHSAKLFETVQIHFIFMEWMKLRAYYGSEADDSKDKRMVFELIALLTERGFTAHGSVLLDDLNTQYWYGWPDDIVWKHKDVYRV